MSKNVQKTFYWYGRTNSGQIVPDGLYKVHLMYNLSKPEYNSYYEVTVKSSVPKENVSIIYNGNNHTGGYPPSVDSVEKGSPYQVKGSNGLVRNSCVFEGWSENASSSTPMYREGMYINPARNMVLYAVWRYVYVPPVEKVTIEYVAPDITSGIVPKKYEDDKGKSMKIAGQGSMVKTGYIFKGWVGLLNNQRVFFQPGADHTLSTNLTLNAVWEALAPKEFKVTYHGNGNTTGKAPDAHSFTVGKSFKLMSRGTLQKQGASFLGWGQKHDQLVSSFSESADVTFNENHDINLYAIWSIGGSTNPTDKKISAWFSQKVPKGHTIAGVPSDRVNWDDTHLNAFKVDYNYNTGVKVPKTDKYIIETVIGSPFIDRSKANWSERGFFYNTGCTVSTFAIMLKNADAETRDPQIDSRKSTSLESHLAVDPFVLTCANMATQLGEWPVFSKDKNFDYINDNGGTYGSPVFFYPNSLNFFRQRGTNKGFSISSTKFTTSQSAAYIWEEIKSNLDNALNVGGLHLRWTGNGYTHSIVFTDYDADSIPETPKPNLPPINGSDVGPITGPIDSGDPDPGYSLPDPVEPPYVVMSPPSLAENFTVRNFEEQSGSSVLLQMGETLSEVNYRHNPLQDTSYDKDYEEKLAKAMIVQEPASYYVSKNGINVGHNASLFDTWNWEKMPKFKFLKNCEALKLN